MTRSTIDFGDCNASAGHWSWRWACRASFPHWSPSGHVEMESHRSDSGSSPAAETASAASGQVGTAAERQYGSSPLHRWAVSIFTSAKEVMFLPDFVCLSVCLCVSKITQKVMDESFWNFEGMSGMAQTTNDSILGMIRKESWILDHFEVFVTIAFNAA